MKKTLFLSAILGAALCSSAFAAEYTFTASDNGNNNNTARINQIHTLSAEDTIIFNKTRGHLTQCGGEINANVRIDALTLTDGYSNNTYTFNGTVTGTGAFSFGGTTTANNQHYVFNGDVSGYSGNMSFDDSKTGSFTFNAATGTGSISGANVTLNLNSATVNASSVNVVTTNVSGTTSIDHADFTTKALNINNGTLTIGNSASLKLTGTDGWTVDEHAPLTSGNGFSTATYTRDFGTSLVNNGTITVNGNNVTLTNGVASATGNSVSYYINNATTYSSNADFANAQKVVINNDVTVTGATGGENGFFHEEVVVNGSLTMGNKDLMGWGGTYVKKLTLEDGATIKLTHDTNETFSGALTMKGTSTITGATASATSAGQWDIHGNSSITVEAGATATISTRELRTRHDNVAISVGNSATLTVSANLTKNGGNGVINKTGNGTLTITGSIANDITLNNNAGTTIVKNVTLTGGTFKGVTFNNAKVNGTITLNDLTGDGKLQTALSGLTKSDAQGASSTIKLGGGQYTFGADTDVNAHHMVFSGDTQINGHGYDGDGHTVALKNGASIDVGAHVLKLESEATLQVTNGSVTSGYIVLGHDTVTNRDQTKNPGFLTLAGGSITTGFIKANNGYNVSDNTFSMTGGTLTFTKPASETTTPEEGDPVTTTYNAIDGVTATITGGTLSTAEAAWKIDNANATLGAVTISGANEATLSHVKLTGTTKIHTNTTMDGGITSLARVTNGYAFLVEGNSTLTLTGADYDLTNADAGIGLQKGSELVVDTDASLTIKTFVYSSTKVADNGSLTVKEGGSVTMKGQGFRNGFLSSIDLDGSLSVNSGAEMSVNTLTGGSTSSLTVNGTMNIYEASTIATLSGTGSLKLNGDLTVTGNSVELGALTLRNGADITVNDHDGSLTTSSLTVAGADSAVNANLIVSDDGTMNFSAGHALTMGCSVKIGSNVTVVIDEAIIEGIVNRGETVAIIDGVDEITSLGSWNFVALNSDGTYKDLSYANLRLEDAGNGTIVVAPEPATATLSLLALAALAARRKRH